MFQHPKTARQIIDSALAELMQLRDSVERESLPLYANMRLEVIGADGLVREVREGHNLICTAGKDQILLATSAESPASFKYAAIGTGTTAASASDTALQTEFARVTGTLSNPSSTVLQIVASYASGTFSGQAITEAGLLDASSSGHLLAHQVFSAITLGSSDSLTITWQIS